MIRKLLLATFVVGTVVFMTAKLMTAMKQTITAETTVLYDGDLGDTPDTQSLTFAALVLIQFVKAYVFRSDRHSVLVRPFANRWLNLAIIWELIVLTLIFYLPPLQEAFGTHALSIREWVIVTAIALTVIPVLEGGKAILRK